MKMPKKSEVLSVVLSCFAKGIGKEPKQIESGQKILKRRKKKGYAQYY